jgi:hypothetical protein
MTTKYSSFSVLGVGLILIIGLMIIIGDFTIELVVDWIQKKRAKTNPNPSGTYARLEWNSNTTLHLQRLAHEGAGVGSWKNAGWAHPVTERGEKLAMIDHRDEEHTTLIAPKDWEDHTYADSEKPPLTASSDAAAMGWTEEEIRQAHASDPKVPRKLRRTSTFDSLDSSISMTKEARRRVNRVDTKTTLVADDDDIKEPISPDMLRKVRSLESEMECQSPVSDRTRSDDEIEPLRPSS